jgi:tetratricopeptide (TPR) repeat protein
MLKEKQSRTQLVALLSLIGCVLPTTTTRAADLNPTEDIFGEPAPALDPQKAHVPFGELAPTIEIKHDTAVEVEPLPDRSRQAMARAATLRDEKRYTEALIELEKAQRIAPSDRRIIRALALTAWQAGDQKRARKHCEESLESGEDDITCHYILGRLAASRFENETAILEYRKALKCSVDQDTEVFTYLAGWDLFETLLASGYVRAAIDHYEVLSASSLLINSSEKRFALLSQRSERDGAEMPEQAAWAYAQLGEYQKGADLLRGAYVDNKPPAERLVDYAKLLARAGDMDGAIEQARKALASQPEAIDVLMAIYKHQNRPDAIVEEFESAIQTGDASPQVATAYATALIEFDRRDEAVRLMKDQLAKPSPTLDTVQAAVDVFLAAQAWELAVEAMADAVRQQPEAATDIVTWIRTHAGAHQDSDLSKAAGKDIDTSDSKTDFARAFVLGNIALAFGQDEAGRVWLERSLGDRPAFVAARVGLAQLHLDHWEWEKAIEIATPEQFRLDRDTRLEVIAGEAYRGLDDPQSAIGHFESAVRLHRGNIDAMLALAELYAAERNPTAARRQLEKIIRIDAFNEKARSQLCLNHLGSGDRRAAAEQIQKLRIHRASPTVVAQCVAALEFDPLSPDFDQFRETLREAIAASRPDADTLQLIGMSYMQQSNWEEAIRAMESALELDPNHLESTSMLLECLQRNLEFDKALALQGELLERYPRRHMWKQNQFELLLTVQRFEEAIDYGRKLIAEPDVNPVFARQLRFEIISAFRALNKNTEAMKEMEMWRNKESDNPTVLTYVIKACQDFGQHDRAMELIRRWNTDIPGGYARGDLNEIWQDLLPEQRSQVLELQVEAITADPQNDQLHTCLIGFLRVTKQFEEALALAKNSAVDGVFKELYLNELQLTYEASGRVDDAVDVIEEMMAVNADAAASNPDLHAFLRQSLVQVLINGGQADQAVERLNEWLKQARDAGVRNTEFLYLSLLSIAHQETGDLDKARQTLEAYFKLDPTNVGLHNDLGYTLADSGVDLERAEKLIRVAVGETPRNSAYLDSLGWVLYKKGQFAEAKRWLELARGGLTGEDPVICEHLGDTLWQLGEEESAIQLWKEGLKLARQRIEHPPAGDADRRSMKNVEARLNAVESGGKPKVAAVISDVVEKSESE